MSYISENFHKFVPVFGKYSNGRIALSYNELSDDPELAAAGYMEPACTATINLPHIELADDEIIVKTYSENEGLYEAMLAFGHISPMIREEGSGFITAPVCKLLLTEKS